MIWKPEIVGDRTQIAGAPAADAAVAGSWKRQLVAGVCSQFSAASWMSLGVMAFQRFFVSLYRGYPLVSLWFNSGLIVV